MIDITLPKVIVKGYVLEKKATLPGKNATSAHIHIPKYLAGDYTVILIPKKEVENLDDTLQL